MLNKLTPEQEAMFPEFVNYGLRIGLRTERTHRPTAEAAIIAHYAACGLSAPEVRWFDSPYGSVRENVRENVGANVRENVGASVWANVWANVRENVGANVWANVGENVRENVGANVWANVRENVWANVRENVGANVRENVGAYYEADYAAWIMAWERYGISLPPEALTYMRMTELVWWMYPGRDVVYASEPPTAIHRDDEGRLHCETGMAITFADGTGFSSWHGETIPDEWVAGSPPSAKDALHWRNMDQRAAACEIVGWHNVLDQLNARTIDDSGDHVWGRLVEVDLPGSGKERFLDALCGTGRRFALPVPPETASVDEAQSVLHGGLPVSILKHCVERT